MNDKQIRPGDLCLMIGRGDGPECNIGTFLTATKKGERLVENWLFKDCSRPLICIDGRAVNSSEDHPYSIITIPEKYLIPIRDADGTDETILLAGLPKTLQET